MKLTLPAGSVEDLGAGVVRVTLPGAAAGDFVPLNAPSGFTITGPDGSSITLDTDGYIEINGAGGLARVALFVTGRARVDGANGGYIELAADGRAEIGNSGTSSLVRVSAVGVIEITGAIAADSTLSIGGGNPVGTRAAAVADATEDLADLTTQFNLLLARMRASNELAP